jgi:acetyl esterase/lipase
VGLVGVAGPVTRRTALIALSICFAVSLTGCTKFTLLDATIPTAGYTRTTDIPYGDLPRQKLDVYKPTGKRAGGKVVIFFYGGDWQSGQKGDYRFVAQALASRGFVTVMPDYRLYPEVRFPTFVEDGASAIRWAHDHVAEFGGDPAQICLMGHSAGAHIAALLTLDEHYLGDVGLDRQAIRATAALSGPYDFVPPIDDRAAFAMTRDQTATDPNIQPITFVDGKAPPMLLVHGGIDKTVSADNARRLGESIRQSGGDVTTVIYPDRAHVGIVLSLAWSFRWLAPTLDKVSEFFKTH